MASPNPLLQEEAERVVAPSVDWVIVGGESGQRARPMHPDWVREVRDRCIKVGTPFFFKQWGRWGPLPVTTTMTDDQRRGWVNLRFPDGEMVFASPRSKKIHGRTLDGRTWDEMPHG